MEKLTTSLHTAKDSLFKEQEMRKRYEEETAKMKAERDDLAKAVESTKGASVEIQERLNALQTAKEQLHSSMDQVCNLDFRRLPI